MKPSDALHANRQAIRDIVAAHRGCRPRVFGSAATGLDTETSDLDLLIEPTPDTTLLDIGAMRVALQQHLGVPVDILTPEALPDRFREAVLSAAILI